MGFLVILLLAIPLAAAIAVACLGQNRALLVRQVSLAASVTGAVIALVLAASFLAQRGERTAKTFRPYYVPGSTVSEPHETTWNLVKIGKSDKEAIQFYVGIDGMNIWLIVLTAV